MVQATSCQTISHSDEDVIILDSNPFVSSTVGSPATSAPRYPPYSHCVYSCAHPMAWHTHTVRIGNWELRLSHVTSEDWYDVAQHQPSVADPMAVSVHGHLTLCSYSIYAIINIIFILGLLLLMCMSYIQGKVKIEPRGGVCKCATKNSTRSCIWEKGKRYPIWILQWRDPTSFTLFRLYKLCYIHPRFHLL